MSTVTQSPITLDEFEKMPDPADGSRLELVRGEVIAFPRVKLATESAVRKSPVYSGITSRTTNSDG